MRIIHKPRIYVRRDSASSKSLQVNYKSSTKEMYNEFAEKILFSMGTFEFLL